MAVDFKKNKVVTAKIRKAVMRGLLKTALDVEREAVNSIQNSPATGRIYVRRGIQHRASAPGEPPATDTGRLVNSSEVNLDPAFLRATIGFTTTYAAALEFGTLKMAPRPYLRPALNKKVKELDNNIKKELSKLK